MEATRVTPDLQASVLCEDIRQEMNGMQSLVGVLNVVPARATPVGLLKLCVWTRWCLGFGKFRQRSRILGTDEDQVVAESFIEFELKELESQVTNVNRAGVGLVSWYWHFVDVVWLLLFVLVYWL